MRAYPKSRRTGGPRPKHNLISDGVEEVAEAVKLHAMTYGRADAFVDDEGYLRMDRPDYEGRFHREESWRVGRYTSKSRTDDIEDDLVLRLNEIQPQQVRA